MLCVISLGAGVQSTTMALMAAHSEITPMPDCAVFADTQWEPKAVYDHLSWLCSGNVLPFPVHRVTAGNLRTAIMDRSNTTGGRFAAVPWFMRRPNGDEAMGRRRALKHRASPLFGWKTSTLIMTGSRDRIAQFMKLLTGNPFPCLQGVR